MDKHNHNDKKTVFRAHPLMFLRFIKPFLVVLVIPLIKGAVQYLMYRRISGVLALEVIAFACIFTVALLRMLRFSLEYEGDYITVYNGFILKRKTHIPTKRLSCAWVSQNPIDFLFNSVSYNLNTEAGNTKKADCSFKLSKDDAQKLWDLLYPEADLVNFKFSAFKIAALSSAGSSFLTGLLVGVPVINYTGKLLGLSLEQLLLNRLNELSFSLDKYFPPAVNLLSLLFIVFYGVSFINALLKNVKFRLAVGENTVKTESGLFSRKHTAFGKKQINCVLIEQTPLMRLFGLYTMSAAVGGYGIGKGERPAIIPCGREKEIKHQLKNFFLNLDNSKGEIKPSQSANMRRRFAFMPIIWYIVIFAALSLVSAFFNTFFEPALFLCLVAAGVNSYYLYLCIWESKNASLLFSKNTSGIGLWRLSSRQLNCESEKIAVIKIARTPADRRYGTCNTELTVKGEGSERVKVKNLDYDKISLVVKQIFE